MNNIDELQKLQDQIVRKKKLDAMMGDLNNRLYELEIKVSELEKKKLSEDKDVQKMEGGSLAAFFYGVVGKRDEKLDKERREAYEATVKYEAAKAEYEALREDIRKKESELMSYADSEERFEALLKKRADIAKKLNGANADKVIGLEKQIMHIDSQFKEIEEALQAGAKALDTTQGILVNLNDAHSWSTYDMFGGGFIADAVKYDNLNKAQASINQLQIELSRFKTELADIKVNSDIVVTMDGFTEFADYFFDGFFMDWTVHGKIEASQAQVKETLEQIESSLGQLKEIRAQFEQEQVELKNQLKDILIIHF